MLTSENQSIFPKTSEYITNKLARVESQLDGMNLLRRIVAFGLNEQYDMAHAAMSALQLASEGRISQRMVAAALALDVEDQLKHDLQRMRRPLRSQEKKSLDKEDAQQALMALEELNPEIAHSYHRRLFESTR